jgi:death-on-curing protein
LALENEPLFLSLADVVRIHAEEIELFGGQYGVRDYGLLQSALTMPEASFGGEWLHRDIYEMAAAYAFHICQNHPFTDGNKRTGLACALIFLELNGISIEDPEEVLYETMINITSGSLDKYGVAEVFRSLSL